MAELDWCRLQIKSNLAIKGASMPFYIQIVTILAKGKDKSNQHTVCNRFNGINSTQSSVIFDIFRCEEKLI